ncbi:MAG: hypothetical protein A4E74_00995 [Syntrophus sp. PtaB.Bin075]|nr:MAG: hypothetical protein A4E74_00995 [Syntrophus sp. PtaB.Bin075]
MPEGLQSPAECAADSVFQFLRRRHGVGHDENLPDLQGMLHNQAKIESADGVGFSSARIGFNQVSSLKGRVEEVKRFHGALRFDFFFHCVSSRGL